jgi:UrcA family protein
MRTNVRRARREGNPRYADGPQRRSRLFHEQAAAGFTRRRQAATSATMTGGLMKTFAIACATLLTGCLAATAQATVSRDAPREVVSYADLNLQSEADAAILVERIEVAARKVCGLRSASPLPIEIVARLRVCAKEATARAITDVNAPAVLRHREIVVRNTME